MYQHPAQDLYCIHTGHFGNQNKIDFHLLSTRYLIDLWMSAGALPAIKYQARQKGRRLSGLSWYSPACYAAIYLLCDALTCSLVTVQ